MKRLIAWLGGLCLVAAVATIGWLWSLPAAPSAYRPPPVSQADTEATLAALRPPKRARPLVAVVGINAGSETTDYILPYGVLKRSGVADVVALATGAGSLRLIPALNIEPDATIAAFDAAHPEGADYVIVPAMIRDDDPVVLDWLRAQARKGATIVGICAGGKVLAEAGLLDGKRATTHWYYVDSWRTRHPAIRYVPDRRLVADRGVVTTTGISASIPLALTLVEAIGGHSAAEAVAREIGMTRWSPRHDSAAFVFNRNFARTAMGNAAAFWRHDVVEVPLRPGMDEVSLALVADIWSRTYLSRARTHATQAQAVTSRNGLRIVPDETSGERTMPSAPSALGLPPAVALDRTLASVGQRYGARTAAFVAAQLEYPR
jgi:putative intracellular protease/amidase